MSAPEIFVRLNTGTVDRTFYVKHAPGMTRIDPQLRGATGVTQVTL